MRVLVRLAALVLLGSFVCPAVSRAAEGIVGQSDLDQAISQTLSTEAANRQAVKDVLGRDAVRSAAGQMGIDLKQANAAVDTLSGAELQRLANQAAAVDGALSGGDTTIQISLVVALLILIIVILLVK